MKSKETTLTIDEDLAGALRERARILNQTIEQVAHDLLRRGLTPRVGEAPGAPYGVKSVPCGTTPREDPKKYKQFLNDEDDMRYLKLTYGEDCARWPEWLRDRWGICVDNPES